MVRLNLDDADRRTLGIMLVGAVVISLGVVWLAWLLGTAVMVFRMTAGG
jgi:hypothetical protein